LVLLTKVRLAGRTSVTVMVSLPVPFEDWEVSPTVMVNVPFWPAVKLPVWLFWIVRS
jgi:hypothetical protein